MELPSFREIKDFKHVLHDGKNPTPDSHYLRYKFKGKAEQVTEAGWQLFKDGKETGDQVEPTKLGLEDTPSRLLPGMRLKDYQLEGVGWMCHVLDKRGACLLADEMGLGKTIQVVAVTLERPLRAPTLIVCPAVMVSDWVEEYRRVDQPAFKILCLEHQRTPEPSKYYLLAYDVVICTYEYLVNRWNARQAAVDDFQGRKLEIATGMAVSEAPLVDLPYITALDINWGRIVLDEAHCIGSLGSKKNLAVCALKGEQRIACTGTPLSNDYTDVGSMLNFLRISPWGDPFLFRRSFMNKTTGDGRSQTLNEERHGLLAITLRSCMLRRLRTDEFDGKRIWTVPDPEETFMRNNELNQDEIDSQINTKAIWEHPEAPKNERYRASGPPPADVRERITSARSKILHPACGEFFDKEGDDIKQGDRYKQLAKATELSWDQSARLREAVKIIKERVKHGKVLVFSEFRQGLVVLANGLTARDVTFAHFNSSTSSTARRTLIKAFQRNPSGDDAPQVLLITSKCGGAGITLTQAKTVLILHPSWTETTDEQCIGRAVRWGQTSVVQVYRLWCSESIENLCRAKQRIKKNKAEKALDIRQVPTSVEIKLIRFQKKDYEDFLARVTRIMKRKEEKLKNTLGIKAHFKPAHEDGDQKMSGYDDEEEDDEMEEDEDKIMEEDEEVEGEEGQ